MDTIAVIILAILAGLISISQYFSLRDKCSDSGKVFSYMILSIVLACSALMSVMMMLSYGSFLCFIFYGLDKAFRVVIMIGIVMLTKHMVSISDRFISIFISIVSYGAAFLFLLDTFLQGGDLRMGLFGVYFSPNAPWHRELYFIYAIVYVILLTVIIVMRGTAFSRKSEKQESLMLMSVYAISAFGFILDPFMINYNVQYFPVIIFTNLISVVLLRRLIQYSESISVARDKFAKELDEGRTDIALILDEKMNVMYQNKRAEIFAQIVNDSFEGRKLSDIFEFSDVVYNQISLKPDNIPFGVIAHYGPTDRNVNLVVQHRINNFGEILATIVFVYNIEESKTNAESVEVDTDDNDDIIVANAVSVTQNARVLVVDEDVVFLNVFTRLLNRYGVVVTRAMNGYDALTLLGDNVYDIIFVTYEMKRMDGKRLVEAVREMQGEYYSQVPVVFITDADINDVYSAFLSTGFNDYLKKPVTHKMLSQVLTRWLWQRFDNDKPGLADSKSAFNGQYMELNHLIEDAIYMYENNKMDKFYYCIKGISRSGKILGLDDLVILSLNIMEATSLDEDDSARQLFESLINGVRDVVTINA